MAEVEAKSRRVVVVQHLVEDQPYGAVVRRDLQAVLSQHPELEVRYEDGAGDAGRQVELLERALLEGVDGLVLAPVDAGRVRPALERFRAAGVPVVVMDSDVGDPRLYRSLVVTDNRHLGREAGEFLAEVLGGAGVMAEVTGIATTNAAAERSAGLREALAGHPGLRVIDACEGRWLYERARQEFEQVLARQPRLDAVFAQNDEMARAVLDAAAAVGREGELVVAGADALPGATGGIRMVGEGRLAATFLNPSGGKEAAHALLAALAGEPTIPRILLKTSRLTSQSRVRAWRAARGR